MTCILEFFSTTPMAPGRLLLETIGQVATQLSRVAERVEEMSVEGRLDGAPALASAMETALGHATAQRRDTVGPV